MTLTSSSPRSMRHDDMLAYLDTLAEEDLVRKAPIPLFKIVMGAEEIPLPISSARCSSTTGTITPARAKILRPSVYLRGLLARSEWSTSSSRAASGRSWKPPPARCRRSTPAGSPTCSTARCPTKADHLRGLRGLAERRRAHLRRYRLRPEAPMLAYVRRCPSSWSVAIVEDDNPGARAQARVCRGADRSAAARRDAAGDRSPARSRPALPTR